MLNGAQALLTALTRAGLDTCFANPGTSEMQLVYEIGLGDTVRPVLCLQENVVTGAADGYARMAGKPAFTLLHVGSGFANGIANLHNASRAHVPIVNIVGANATYHQPNFPEHEMVGGTIKDLAAVVSHWVAEARDANEMGPLGAEAVSQAIRGGGRVATLIAPTNCHWDPASEAPVTSEPEAIPRAASSTLQHVASLLKNGKKTALLLGGAALQSTQLELAAQIAAACNATLVGETFPTRLSRGAGQIKIPLVPYFVEMAQAFFSPFEQLILIGAKSPVSTFAYRGLPASKIPPHCNVVSLVSVEQNIAHALTELAAMVGQLNHAYPREERPEILPEPGQDVALTAESIGRAITQYLPEAAIIVDESATAGLGINQHCVGAEKHEYLYAVPGASIGNGLPMALGAAIACPDQKVLALQADGSAMYTNQALWSIAREQCDVTIVIIKNDAYAILDVELARVREDAPNSKMQSMLALDNPSIDWVQLAKGLGIEAVSASTEASFYDALKTALNTKGPRLIEACIAQNLQPVINMVMQQKQKHSDE